MGYKQLGGHRPILEGTPHVGNAYKQYSVHLRRPRPPLTPLTHGRDLYLLQLSREESMGESVHMYIHISYLM